MTRCVANHHRCSLVWLCARRGSSGCVNKSQDSYRLPEGMKRVGYDSDTGKYYFRDQDGSLWEGAEGAEYGQMTRGVYVVSMHTDPGGKRVV